MESTIVQAAYEEHGAALHRFLFAILRDQSSADDALHETFETFIEKGDDVSKQSIRAWLFRVAYQKAMLVKRKSKMRSRHHEKIAWGLSGTGGVAGGKAYDHSNAAEHDLILGEDVERVRAALAKLKPELQAIVKMRIHEGMKFREIAEKLGMPLGTALTRMRTALKKLKDELAPVQQ